MAALVPVVAAPVPALVLVPVPVPVVAALVAALVLVPPRGSVQSANSSNHRILTQ